MASDRIGDLAAHLATALAGRLNLPEGSTLGAQADASLQARVLDLYARELGGLEEADSLRWLLRRMAMIEARLLALQAHVVLPTDPDGAEALLEDEDPVAPGALRLACDADLVQGGFHPAETSAEGLAFRWIGPAPQANVFLPRMRLPLEARLHVYSAFLPEVVPEVRLALDGGEWVPVAVRESRDGLVLSARLEAGPLSHGGLLRLDIDTVRTESPLSRGGSDGRQFSLALSAIEVESL
jgi:hypothetical protein